MANPKRKRRIKIRCKGSRMELLSKLSVIQGGLKELSAGNLAKLRNRIETKGFDAPLFVWGNKILDGAQRKAALESLLAEGWTLPAGKVPVCDIEAESLDQAKDRLLGFISQYGKLTQAGFSSFVSSVEAADLETIDVTFEAAELAAAMPSLGGGPTYREFTLKPYRMTHVLLSFPPEVFSQIRGDLETIIAVKGVEYEQGSN